MCVDRGGSAPRKSTAVPDYCTSTRRLRSRMYFPSLYFWDCSYALSCKAKRTGPVSQNGGWMERAGVRARHAHIFPAKYGLALAAIDVPHGVVSCSHLTVIWLAFDNVNPAHIHPSASARQLVPPSGLTRLRTSRHVRVGH
jgi:hypothetical protein